MPNYSVEFFHIYLDEKIGQEHIASIDYLKMLQTAWPHKLESIVFIDDYNSKKTITSSEEVLKFLADQGVEPKFWAYEGDLVVNAEKLLSMLTNNKLRDQYFKYIQKHNKYPCSLLAASWYLTRLGRLDPTGVIKSSKGQVSDFTPADRLINILPRSYRSTEERILKLICNSEFSHDVNIIQDLFYDSKNGKIRNLF
jgi:hypothetical protein